jgi:hypothetical protein
VLPTTPVSRLAHKGCQFKVVVKECGISFVVKL